MFYKNTEMNSKLRQFIAIICVGPITLGMSVSWTSPVLPQLQNQNSTLPFTLTVDEGSWVGSMLAIGVLCTAILSGYLADRFGLKRCIFALALPNVIFAIIVMFAKDVYSLCIARFISGIGGGGVSVLGPMYISEIADVSIRGILGSFFALLIFVGIIFVSICGAYLHYLTLTAILGSCSLIFGIIFLFLPESPTYLVKNNQKEKAEAALKFYRSHNFDVSHKIKQIEQNLQEQQELKKVNVMQALMSRTVVRGLVASVGLTIFQELTGVDAVIFYSVQIFQKADTIIDENTSAIILSVVQLLGSAFVIFIIEKANRKFFLYLSAVICGITIFLTGFYFQLKEIGIYFVGIDYIPLVSMIFYAIGFSLGLGPVPWMVNGELFSHEIKGVANGITVSNNWISLFLITKLFPIAVDRLPPQYVFYFFSVCMMICVVFVKFFVLETRGKSLDQIQKELS